MTYELGPTLRGVLRDLEEIRRERAKGIEQTTYTVDTRNERADSRITSGPDSELIPPGRGRLLHGE